MGGLKSGHRVILIAFKGCSSQGHVQGWRSSTGRELEVSNTLDSPQVVSLYTGVIRRGERRVSDSVCQGGSGSVPVCTGQATRGAHIVRQCFIFIFSIEKH